MVMVLQCVEGEPSRKFSEFFFFPQRSSFYVRDLNGWIASSEVWTGIHGQHIACVFFIFPDYVWDGQLQKFLDIKKSAYTSCNT